MILQKIELSRNANIVSASVTTLIRSYVGYIWFCNLSEVMGIETLDFQKPFASLVNCLHYPPSQHAHT